MWRSATVSLFKNAAKKFRTIPNPSVVCSSSSQLALISRFQHFSTPKPSFLVSQNPRFFSNLSPDIDGDDDSTIESAICSPSESEDQHFSPISDENDGTQIEGFEVDLDKSEGFEVDLDKLESVLSLLQSSGDAVGSLESSFNAMGLSLNEEFVVRVLETPFVPANNLIGFFKWSWKNPGFSVTTRAVDALVRAVCQSVRRKDTYSLWDLVKEIGEKENGVLNVGILNELIAQFAKLGKGKAGLEVFNAFGEYGCEPNADSYYFTIEALCRRSIFDWALSVCEKMLNASSLPDSEKVWNIISWFCKGRKVKDAYLVYLLAKEKNKYPPKTTVNFLIASLCREDGTISMAVEMLDDFSGEERKYAIKPYTAVIRGLCRSKDVDGAKRLLLKMIEAGPPPGNAVFNFVINGLSKAGEMEEAMKMNLNNLTRRVELLGEMKEHGVQPNTDEYNKLIQSLCLKALDWQTAEKLLEEMKQNGLHLNGITRGLIRAVKELEEEGRATEELRVEA
eukprot:XP_010646461.1 PREDICTED: pentatricopeptide repeat-containing protein At3g02650, mitochondrial [Vitis vinifera]